MYARRKESRRERDQFLKNPYEAAKKWFIEVWSGKLKYAEEELDTHVKQTYSDPKRKEPLPYMRGPQASTALVVSILPAWTV